MAPATRLKGDRQAPQFARLEPAVRTRLGVPAPDAPRALAPVPEPPPPVITEGGHGLPYADASSGTEAKIALFRALFAGREDVYATRWVSAKSGRTGWSSAEDNPFAKKKAQAERVFWPLTDRAVWSDDVCVVESTPVGCGCSRETAKRSDLAGWAQYGYCTSHSRYFWGLRLHQVCAIGGLPVLFALTGAKADERETLRDMLDTAPDVTASHSRQKITGDKNYYGREFERDLTERELVRLRTARKGEAERAGAHLFKPLRQVIESINQTFKGQSWSTAAPRAGPRPRRLISSRTI
ncbi:Transposase DDE domain protein [Streptomyces sp. ADI98-10]|nr:Transposase DDE domain protein [Streptomyces sp. ADI98-10]